MGFATRCSPPPLWVSFFSYTGKQFTRYIKTPPHTQPPKLTSQSANELVRGWPGPLDPGPPAGRLSFTKGAPTLRRALVPATRGDKGASDPVGAVDDDHPNPFV